MYRMGNTDPKAQFTLHYAGARNLLLPLSIALSMPTFQIPPLPPRLLSAAFQPLDIDMFYSLKSPPES